MKNQGTTGILMFALLAFTVGAMGCEAEADRNAESGRSAAGGANPGVDPTVTATTPKPIALLETTSTRLKVFEDRPGAVVVSEEGTAGTGSVLEGWDGTTSTLMDMYGMVAPKLKTPLTDETMNVLRDADLRIASLAKQLNAQEPEPEPSSPTLPEAGP